MRFILLLTLFTSFSSFAVPVFNRNVSTSGNSITIWPDHKDPNQFYYAPTRMNIALDEVGKAQFNIIDYTTGRCRFGRNCERKLLMTTYFESVYKDDDIKTTKEKILLSNPKANFSPVPFISSQVVFGTALLPFIEEHNCAPMGGQAADLVPCTIVLNSKGIHKLLPSLAQGKRLAFNFTYKLFGVVENANSTFKDYEVDYAIAVNLGGDVLVGLPELQEYL